MTRNMIHWASAVAFAGTLFCGVRNCADRVSTASGTEFAGAVATGAATASGGR